MNNPWLQKWFFGKKDNEWRYRDCAEIKWIPMEPMLQLDV